MLRSLCVSAYVVALSAGAAHGQAPVADAGRFNGEVSSDYVETDPGGLTVINFRTPFTTTEQPEMHVVVVLRLPANGLVEGASIKAVEEIQGSPGNWTGFTLTVSKHSDGSSITDTTRVYVTWMAVSPTTGGNVPAIGNVGLIILVVVLLSTGAFVVAKRQRPCEA